MTERADNRACSNLHFATIGGNNAILCCVCGCCPLIRKWWKEQNTSWFQSSLYEMISLKSSMSLSNRNHCFQTILPCLPKSSLLHPRLLCNISPIFYCLNCVIDVIDIPPSFPIWSSLRSNGCIYLLLLNWIVLKRRCELPRRYYAASHPHPSGNNLTRSSSNQAFPVTLA